MTTDELRAKYTEAVKTLRSHRKFWVAVVNQGQPEAQRKVEEIDQVIKALEEMKDELKVAMGIGYEQPTLLDVPKKTEYR